MILEIVDEGFQEPAVGPMYACCWFIWWAYFL